MCRKISFLLAILALFCGHQTVAAVTIDPPSLQTPSGREITITCKMSGGETFLGWFKPDKTKVPQSSSATVHVEVNINTFRLKFTDVKVEEGGEYECRSRSGSKGTFTLEVLFDISNVDPTQHIKIGREGTINLGVRGYPKPTITWKKEKTTLNAARDPRYTLLNDGSLKIKNVKIADQGNYTVNIQQGASGKVVEIEVYAVEHPKIVAFPDSKKYLTEGYSAVFICKATARPPPKYEWLNPKGTKITSFWPFEISGGNLTIKRVTRGLNGTYTCRAYNVIEKVLIGEVKAKVAIVAIHVPPTIRLTIGNGPRPLEKGEKATLTCKAKGSPIPTVKWIKNGQRDPRQTISKRGESIIAIEKVQLVDGGKYICQAWNSAVDSNGKVIVATKVHTLDIIARPFINVQASPSIIYSYIGNTDPTYISCTFGGSPVPWVVMTFNKKLQSNASSTANVSIITNSKKKFGTFHCRARNRYGIKNQTIQLKEVESPGLVREFAHEAKCDSVTLTWKKPSKDGGMPITKFVLDYRGLMRNIDALETSYTVTELDRNKKYSFDIRATNKGAWGPKTTTTVTTKKYCEPGRPIIYEPKDMDLEETSFTLKWRRPQDDGGDKNIEYIVRYRDETESKPGPWKEFVTKKQEHRIKNLGKDKKYKVEVMARNKGGNSSPDERFYRTTKITIAASSQSRLVASVLVTFMVGIFHLL
ncbi:neural cell adhesion molecule 2-like [Acropora palmata]|uniref:neural cell adhesion molecule 2-like n=1 Tax=Acropora palmata TaxID=6131 RepID=UPI003DA110DD